MYFIFTEREIQQFSSKTQARRFYREAVRECEGSEQDRYMDLLDAIDYGHSDAGCKVNFTGTKDNTRVLIYDEVGNYLKPASEEVKKVILDCTFKKE